MNPNKETYTQLSLFTNPADNTSDKKNTGKKKQTMLEFPKTYSQSTSPFEMLFIAIKQIINMLETGTKNEAQQAAILRKRYLENMKDIDTAKFHDVTPERIRQIRTKLASQLMSEKNECAFRLKNKLLTQLKSLAPTLTAQDPYKVLRCKNGTLPFSLLDFVNMTTFTEHDTTDLSFIAPNEQVIPLQHHIRELIKLLRSTYTPMETSTILEAMPALVGKWGIAFHEEWLQQIIQEHPWIETIGSNVQLRYEGLRYPSLKVARIIYENKRIHKDDIIRIYNERETSDEEKIKGKQMSLSILVKKRDSRFQSQGKSGIWTFQEEARQPKKPILQVLHEYVEEHNGLINMQEVEQHVLSLDYHYPIHTLRCYLLKDCVSSVKDANLLCLQGEVRHYPHIQWRTRVSSERKSCKMPPYYYDIMNKVKELLNQSETHRLPRKDVAKTCKTLVPAGIEPNIVYKIIKQKMKDTIDLIQLDGTDYLQLK